MAGTQTITERIREGQRVVGADGKAIGRVTGLAGSLLALEAGDPKLGPHRYLDVATIATVEGEEVRLLIDAAEANERLST
ncbi:hypothetical protein ABIE41_000210 [Bosea sp. OAE506]|uniref:DUF2171 domain-containing protein n=1 Tax=Bosea sp. OAE506 TaxID=2663870 RepID=UPI00178AA20F